MLPPPRRPSPIDPFDPRERGKTEKGRYTYRFVGVITGRIGPDGIARGSVSSATRYTETGFFPKVCRSKKASFAAAP
jgi:hypothetical protein